MRWGLLSVRVGILIVSVITTMLLLLAVVPLASGGLDIKFPQGENSGWNYDNSTNTVSFGAPVEIYNGGFYDIQAFTVGIALSDHNGSLISRSNSTPTDILAGRTTLLNVRMAVDLDTIKPSFMRELAFNHTTLNMSLTISSYYMVHLVNIHLGANETMDWSPLIDNLQFDLQGMVLQQNGAAYDVQVPYSFDAGDLIVGQLVSVGTMLSDQSGLLGSGSDNISITQQFAGEMRIGITQAAAEQLAMNEDNLTVDVVIDFHGARFEQAYTRHWDPLISDLVVGTPTISSGVPLSASVPFGFDASIVITGQQMQVQCSLENATANISQGSSSLTVLAHTAGQASMPFSVAESVWFLQHSEDWTVNLKVTVMGITVEQSRPYHWNAPLGAP
jgi:hypothetical protein